MKHRNFATLWLGGVALVGAINMDAQITYSTTGYTTDADNVTMKVTQQVTTRLRRTTSQGDPNARLENTPGDAPSKLALPLAESVMVRYPDYRSAYWKDYTYVQGYMFEVSVCVCVYLSMCVSICVRCACMYVCEVCVYMCVYEG